MVPPEGMGVLGVKASVTETEVFPATRSGDAMMNDVKVTCVNIPPDATAVEARVSTDVLTLTPTAPAVTEPIVNPLIVTVNADAPIVAPDVVITNDVAVVGLHVTVSPAMLLAPDATLGVLDEAKKPEG